MINISLSGECDVILKQKFVRKKEKYKKQPLIYKNDIHASWVET